MEAAVLSMALKIVGNKLAPLLIKEYTSIVGVKRDLEDLRDQVEEINSWLETRYEVVWNDPSLNWLKRLKDVAYAIDDVVDEFQLKAEKHAAAAADGGGIISKYVCTKPKSFILQCKVASKIKKIKRRFDEIVKQRTDYNAITNSISVDPPVRQTNMRTGGMSSWPDFDVSSVVGRDEDKNHIISKLLEIDHQLKIKIISVIGLGGSGKTTLAKLVFNDGNIKMYFDITLWVHVSQEFDVDKLVKKMFEAFADNNPGQHGIPYMRKTISDKLAGKRFLLVLDDVWTESRFQWEEFSEFLINTGAPGSRILLTTRSSKVAETVGSTDQFLLPLLSEANSWKLFIESCGMAANHLGSEFRNAGKEIVDKCGGVPLAIKVLAGVLHGKEHIDQWKALSDNNLLYVEGEEHRIAACLRLSYFNLPSDLKQCFTICSLFPKGHMIDKEQLIDLWISHDMISVEDPFDYLNLEYVAHKHFNSLLEVSFLQNLEEKDGRLTCGMHDLVHDLALSIVGDEISLGIPCDATSITKSYRYFSLIKGPYNLVPKNIFIKARAVFMHWFGNYTYVMKALKHAKHLRSVTVPYVVAKEANTISQFKHLKYLAMSCERLPQGIVDISSLQALHILNGYAIFELPKSIGKLKKLRTLNLSGCTFLKGLPESIGDCQMISSIDLSNCMDLTVLPYSIGRNEKLRVLRLRFTHIERLPSIITTLRNLECLDLQGCWKLVDLPEDIGNLEKLQVLNLKDCTKLGGMPIGIGQLSQLEKLGLFVVGKGEKFAGISELANVSRIGEELTIRGISHVMDPNDAHMVCLKQKTNLQRLGLHWMPNKTNDLNTFFEITPRRVFQEEVNTQENVLDVLEPPPSIIKLDIQGYLGRRYAGWMQSQVVGGRVQGPAPFPFLRVMWLCDLPNLKHLDGLVELPCLEELMLHWMGSVESISGGPFPSLVKLEMFQLPRLGEVWMVPEGTMPNVEDGGGGCYNLTPHLGQVRVGSCLTHLTIDSCPKLEVMPCFPPSLQQLLVAGNEQLLQSPRQCRGSSSSPSFNKLKKLALYNVKGLESGHGWELLQHMPALESLRIICTRKLRIICVCGERIELPESVWSLTSLRSLELRAHICMLLLPESLGEFRHLQELTIEYCRSLTSLPQSMGQLCSLRKLVIKDLPKLTYLPESICSLSTSLQELEIDECPVLKSLPQGMEGLVSLETLSIWNCRGLTSLPQGMKGLVSLRKLSICDCPGIQSLPEGIKGLTTLKELQIRDCPHLVRRYEEETGEDRHLISHIPDCSIWLAAYEERRAKFNLEM